LGELISSPIFPDLQLSLNDVMPRWFDTPVARHKFTILLPKFLLTMIVRN
jgi:hypothetical protein